MRMAAGIAAGVVLLVGAVGGCGDGERLTPSRAGDIAGRATSPAPDRGEVVASESTVPAEPGDQFADIAISPDAAARAWRRFGLTGTAPRTDFRTEALLFVGFGESGSCPARFNGVVVDGAQVNVALEREGATTGCTDDYNAQTLVIEAAREALPDAGFDVIVDGASFPLAATPAETPPPGPPVVSRVTAESPRVELVARVGAPDSQGPVELFLTNRGDVSAGTGGWPMTLLRWDEQRWLPAEGQTEYEEHPAIDGAPVDVGPGETQRAAVIGASGLPTGWYSVVAKLQLGGGGGAAVVQGVFEISP